MAGPDPVARRSPDLAAVLNDATRLQTQRSFRDAQGLFFVEGVRNFIRAVEGGLAIDRIVFSERLLIHPRARQLVRQCRRSGVVVHGITPEHFRQLSQTKRASGIAAILRQRWTPLSDVGLKQGLAWMVLETVRTPGNLGTLIRSSEALGGAGFILVGNRIDPYDPAVVRAAMGAVYRQSFVRTDWETLRIWVARASAHVVGACPDGTTDLPRCTFPKTPLLVLGEERKGLTRRQRALCNQLVRIPMQDGSDSLNLGVAGSLLLYEVRRGQPA